MNMQKMLRMGAKALRLQGKKYPDKRFKDDDGKMVSFNDIADQIDALLETIYMNHTGGMAVYLHGKNEWIVKREGGKKRVRHNRHRDDGLEQV